MLDSRERFSATAELYDKNRPSYPSALLDWILGTCAPPPGGTILDIGCGTGISTRLFAARGFDVVGIDPNEAMLASAQKTPGVRYQRGEASATGLAAGSIDLVTAAQSFHWFANQPTLVEFARILKPGGHCAAFWNVRSQEPGFMSEYDDLLRSSSREYATIESHEKTLQALAADPHLIDKRQAEFPNEQRCDRDGLLGRAFSSSYVVHGVEDRESFEERLLGLFHRHAQGGVVALLYRSVGICFRLDAGALLGP